MQPACHLQMQFLRTGSAGKQPQLTTSTQIGATAGRSTPPSASPILARRAESRVALAASSSSTRDIARDAGKSNQALRARKEQQQTRPQAVASAPMVSHVSNPSQSHLPDFAALGSFALADLLSSIQRIVSVAHTGSKTQHKSQHCGLTLLLL